MSALPKPPLRVDAKYSVFPSLESRREKSPALGSSTGGARVAGAVHAASLFGRVDTNRSRKPLRSEVKNSSVSSAEAVGLPSNAGLFTMGPRLWTGPYSQLASDALWFDSRTGAHNARFTAHRPAPMCATLDRSLLICPAVRDYRGPSRMTRADPSCTPPASTLTRGSTCA